VWRISNRAAAELNGLARQRIGAGDNGLAAITVAAVARPTIGINAQSGNIRKNGFSIALGSAMSSAPCPR